MRQSKNSDRDSSSGKPKSLYRELTVALVVLVSLVSIMVNLVNYLYSSHEAKAGYESELSNYEAYLHEALEWPLWNIDDELIIKLGSAFASNAEIVSLTIRDDQQRIVYQMEKPDGNQVKRKITIEHNGQNIGSVEIGLTFRMYEERNRHLLLISITTMVLLIVVLLGATRWILSRLLRKPVDAFIGATGDMVEGKYQQIELPETYVEFAPILSGFKTMSDAVASRENSLRENEEKFRKITESAQDAIIMMGADQRVSAWNLAAERLFGYTAAEAIGQELHPLIAPRETHQAFKQGFEHFLQTGTGPILGKVTEIIALRKGGEAFPVEGSLSALSIKGQWNAIGIFRDITERKKSEEELRRYKDHLEEEVQQRTVDLVLARNAAEAANLAKSVFLSSMSHELRTPLNAILGFSNMMRKDPLISEEQRVNLDIINRSGEHLLALINDVLEMAKIEAGSVQLENAPFDLGGLVRDVTDMMHLRAQEKGLQLLIDQSSKFPRYIKGDEARLRQMLINLVGNAVKFTQQGGVTVRFGMKPHTTPQRLLIEVEDSGCGIKPENQQKIFDPFVQLGQTSMQTGTGLGLAITRQFVQLMGGTISVESNLGKGSTFRMELPVDKVTAADVVKLENVIRGDIVSLAPDQPEYRILIVEDQLENQLLLTKLMENIGFPVKVAENGEQALELFQSWRPHLIWMDRRMPVMDGVEATRRIRELPGGKEVKIVAVTASAFMEQRNEMLDAGMDDFVRKPYRFNEIYECLTKQLGVQYTYADMHAEEEVTDVALTAQMLAMLPEDLRRELHDALESLESERIAAVIGQVAPYDSKLHKTLSYFAGNFDYPAILKALQTNQPENTT